MLKSKKAIFFSTDALIAMLIILSILLIAFPTIKYTQRETEIHHDILKTLSSLKLSESNDQYLQSLISQGIINDTNKSVLEQIGEFYVTNKTLARALASSILSDVKTNKNIGIWYGNSLIYSINTTPIETAENIETARQIVSGIQEGGSVTGFSAKAVLISGLQNKYFYFGGYDGDGNITIRVEYNGNITAAEIELTINNEFKLYINGISNGTIYQKSSNEFTPVSYKIPINNFNTGVNTIEIKGDALHIAGGFIKITYKSSAIYEQPSRYYFPGISGLINVYDGFYVPGDLTNLKILLHIGSPIEAFLTIGNKTIFKNLTQGEETIVFSNSYLSSLLDYNSLSKKTIPLRLGLENVSFVSQGKNADVFSVTDISGSMGGQKLADAKNATNQLIDILLNYSGNRVGLVGYNAWARKINFHNLSNDSASLKSEVNSWNAGGYTCICCGILKAINCFDNTIFKDNFNGQTVGTNPVGWGISEGNGAIDISSRALEGDRAVSITRLSSQNPEMYHIIAPQQDRLSIEFLVNQTSGPGRVKAVMEGATSGFSSSTFEDYIILKMYDGWIRNNNNQIVSYNLNMTYKIKIDILPGASIYDLYVDNVLVGNDLPVSSTRNNIARIRFTTEDSNASYILDDFKVFLIDNICDGDFLNDRAMIVMSDGQANRACGLDPVADYDIDGDTSNDAQDHAIQAACNAHNGYNMTVHAVGFGTGADEITLQKIAQCGNGSYYFSDVGELANLYKQIAEDIIKAIYKEQTITATGNVSTILYSDSYIEFNYTKQTFPYGLIITTEKKFDNNFSGTFALPENATIAETRTTSYSGSKWTDKVSINNNLVYNITEHGQTYIKIGDPYIIHIPNYLVQQNNIVNTTTGLSPTNSTQGSEYNKIIYTVVKNASAYSKISPKSEGCIWTIEFEDNTNFTISIPMSYSGSENCYYQENKQEYNDNDAAQNAIFELLQLLDLNSNSKVELKFTEQDLQIDLTEITGIPYTWSTEVQARTWY